MPRVQIIESPQPHPFAGQNAQAFVKIFQTLGHFEGLRRKKMMDSDILGVLQRGGDPETIMRGVAGAVQRAQEPQYSPEFLPGLLQRIAAPFAEAPGARITDALTAQAFRSPDVLSPSQQISQYRLQNINALKAKIGTGRGTEEDEAELKRLIGPTPVVQIGPKLLTDEQRQLLADKDFAEEMGLSEAQTNTARRSVKTLVDQMSHGTWAGDMKGFKNFKRGNLIAVYNQYRNENTYADKSAENRARLDVIFDGQMKTYNQAGYGEHGKNEFDWDPNDAKVQKLRKEAANAEIQVEGRASPEEKAAYKKVLNVWQQMPGPVRVKILAMRGADFTWEEIITAKDLIPYLGE